VLIAGGTGFLGTALTNTLSAAGHELWILTRRSPKRPNQVQWDGKTATGWGHLINEMDAVVHLTGWGLEHWPWTKRQKEKFINSRVVPGRALVSAIQKASRRPPVFVQTSGINYYGLRGEGIADESTMPAGDYLARLTVQWEDATKSTAELGVRRVITRNAVVLDGRRGLFPLMALPMKLLFGGKFGSGEQMTPWIHLTDYARAVLFLMEEKSAFGPYNLIAPNPVTNAEFMHTIAQVLHRPYWFHVSSFLLQLVLGEMSLLLTEGRASGPKRLIELGFAFRFGNLREAMEDVLIRK
jgi:uncharacterized protein (TIGR01777 family)